MLTDFLKGFQIQELWFRMASNELKSKYRRSLIGPFWATLSFAFFIGALGLLYAQIFNQDPEIYVPHLVLGFLIWNLMSQVMMESCQLFSGRRMYILEINQPLTIFILLILWKNFVLFCYCSIVFIATIVIFAIKPSFNWIYSVLALALIMVNLAWIAMLISIVSARYHDFSEIIANVLRVLFFLTPILWIPGMAGRYDVVLNFNPVYFYIEIFRSYFLSTGPERYAWVIVFGFTALGWAYTTYLYQKYKNRIAFWI